ncbi:ESPR-type extended signal peptide-containing protein [uncultured Acinetobacter sp.]|uniref:ESPR-type extended signal peptide-containing protein n=1 Tax=uncultured Acinetobacter sp. TaxID=165433 RepID=UPI0026119019|nr:ESPR-type extended signal peptide-containing protein [uncultured Acinetobacter sp.]
MNKVFKTVWNASLGVWVAVSETASSQKKGSNKLKKAAANAVATVAIGAAAVASTGAMAYNNNYGTTSGSGAIAVGSQQGNATANGNNTTAIGTSSNASGQGATAVGKSANATGQNATSIGQDAKSVGNSLAVGGNAQATGLGSTALGVGSKAQYESSLAVGNNVEAKGKNAIAIGATATGQDAIALGGTATGEEAISIGGIATGKQAISIGGEVLANNAIVLGKSTIGADAAYSVALGYNNRIDSENTFILGSNITTSMQNSVLLGNKSELTDVYTSDVVSQAQYAYTAADGTAQTGSKEVTFAGLYDPNKTESVQILDADGNPVFDADGNATFEDRPISNPGAVSVGAVGAERQIQNVGAGRITSDSTDAVNGSQLYYVLSEAQQAIYNAEQPITFLDAAGGQATVKLGDTFNINGATLTTDGKGNHTLTVDAAAAAAWKLSANGADGVAQTATIDSTKNTVAFVGDQNITVQQTQDAQGTKLEVKLDDTIELTENGGLTIAGGDVFVLDADGNKIPEKDADGNPVVDPQGNSVYLTQNYNPITINQGNVNFGGNVISGVAPGVAGTDAVNVDQLKGSGWGLGNATVLDVDGKVVTDANGQPVTTAKINPDDQVEHKAGPSNNVTVNTTVQKVELTDENGDVVLDANGQPVLIDKATVTVDLADQINLSKDGGLTVAGGDTYNLLDADGNELPTTYVAGDINLQQGNVSFGGNQIHDVAVGTALTDAVNVSQLKDALDTLGGGATVNADGSINAPSYTVGAGNTTVNTVGDAIDVLNQGFTLTSSNAKDVKSEQIQAGDTIDITVTKDKNLEVTQTDNKIEFALADQINLSKDGGLTIAGVPELDPVTGAPLVDPITGLPVYEAGKAPITINQGNVSFGGNQIHNVAAGTAPTDAVNVSQLQSAGWNIIAQDKGTGNLTENAVNGDKDANTSAVQFNGDKNISVSQKSEVLANGDTKTTIEVELEKDIDLSAAGSLKIGDTLVNNAGLTLAGATVGSNVYGPIVINQGKVNFGGNVIGGVAKGVADDDAVNVSQLKDEIGKAVSDSGWTLTTAGDSTTAEKIKPNDTVDFSGDALGNIQVSNTGGNVTIALDPTVDLTKDGSLTIGDTLVNNDGLSVGDTSVNKDGLTVAGNGVAQLDAAGNVVRDQDGNVVYTTGKGDITVEQDNVSLGGNQINDVARADQDHQAVNLGQLKDELGGLEQTINNNIATSGWNLTGQDADGNAVTEKVNPDETVEFVAGPSGNTTVTTESTPNGAKVTVDIKDQITLTGDAGSLTIGAGKGNNAITIEQGNVSVGGNQIHNLAAGTDGKDAVNVDQLTGTVNIFGGGAAVNPDGSIKAPTYNVNGGSHDNVGDALGALNQADIDLGDRVTNLQQSFNNRIDDVEDRMSAGIASAMALETAPYVPGKYTYAAATAYHNGQAALGITLRKTADNGRWSLTGGVATGTEGDPSVRLGVSGIID